MSKQDVLEELLKENRRLREENKVIRFSLIRLIELRHDLCPAQVAHIGYAALRADYAAVQYHINDTLHGEGEQ